MQQDRHSDILDEASALEASLTEAAIAAVRKANGPETHPDFDGESCLDCGETIPKDRLALGKIRCVHCQSRKEHLGKQSARPGWNNSWDQ